MKMLRDISCLLLLAVSCGANANLITIEPDDFAPGTNLGGLTDGVTLSVEGNEVDSGRVATDVFAVSGSASTGDLVFGNRYDDVVYTQGWAQEARALRVDFDRLVDWVAIDIIGRNSTIGEVLAFGRSGKLIGSYRTDPLLDLTAFETALLDTKIPISHLLIGAVPGQTSFPTVRLDNLRYAKVPEPTTIGLLCIGLIAIRLMNRRKLA